MIICTHLQRESPQIAGKLTSRNGLKVANVPKADNWNKGYKGMSVIEQRSTGRNKAINTTIQERASWLLL
ncbi:MAG: hypothetical protein Q7T48_01735 [Cellvibrio sp.]|uniref:hypothetical protein n=1 Tax=Cellvibrio sp. TaxID=1965322 RepID=UPI00272543CB|nr:hypothetical protein [Cellvibrio sp.]